MASEPLGLDRSDFETCGRHAKLPLRLWLRLFSCTGLIEREIRGRLRREFAMSLPKFDYLSQLYRIPGHALSMGELGHRLMVSGGNITGLTDRLEADGMVERKAHSSDRRVQMIALTAKGRSAFARIAGVHETWLQELFSGLDAGEQDRLMDALAALKRAVREKADGAPDAQHTRDRHDG